VDKFYLFFCCVDKFAVDKLSQGQVVPWTSWRGQVVAGTSCAVDKLSLGQVLAWTSRAVDQFSVDQSERTSCAGTSFPWTS